MAKFRIQSHGRLQEWVAEEKGYFSEEGLDYEFLVKPIATWSSEIESTESAPAEVQRGAFESIEDGRGCNLSLACHWTVNMAASAGHGKMYTKGTPLRRQVFMLLPNLRSRRLEIGASAGDCRLSLRQPFPTLQNLEKFLIATRSSSTLPDCFWIGWRCW